jgi:hypothetical protein
MARFLVIYYAGAMAQDPASIAQARHSFTQRAAKTRAALAYVGGIPVGRGRSRPALKRQGARLEGVRMGSAAPTGDGKLTPGLAGGPA